MMDLTIGDETFRVMVEGDALKPALMLSNSLGTDLSMWEGQMPALTRHFRVIRYDPRGHGSSRAQAAPTSVADLGRDALAILDALEIEKTHWAGLSMGGAVGLWLLINAPDRVERAVLANTAARFGAPDTWNARIASVLSGGMAENAKATIERWFSPAFTSKHPERVEPIRAMLDGAEPRGYAAVCAVLRDMDLRAAAGIVGHEVLIVTGRDDPVIPPADAEALIASIAGASHVVLEAKHMSNIEAEADFNAAVVAFLTRPLRKPKAGASSRARTPRKPPATKAVPVKRAGAGRRSNPARNPLKKTTPKKAASRKARPARKAADARRRPTAKRSDAGTAVKAAPKQRAPAKATSKAAPARRPTPTAAARGAVKKAKPAKRGAAKLPAKKTSAKGQAKTTTKKLPTARRKPAKKPRRPTGRRKS